MLPYSGLVHEWVAEATGRVTVLLGAGASVPARLPVSKELTKIVIDELGQDSQRQEAWDFIRGRVDENIIDVEQLWRSIDELKHVLTVGSPWFDLVDVPQDVTATRLGDVQKRILDVTVTTLRRRSVNAPTAYLDPLVRADLVQIASLNFDTLVETAAERCGTAVATGADEWDGGFRWPVPRDATPLLKIHGSLDWQSIVLGHGPIPVSGFETVPRDAEHRFDGRGIFSDLRFGHANKLTQDGAMPALLYSFSELLEDSDLVVTVGYGFRDVHVDVALDRWAAKDESRRLLVVDPTRDPYDLEALERTGSAWFGHTVAGLRHDVWSKRNERVRIIDESAETAFNSIF